MKMVIDKIERFSVTYWAVVGIAIDRRVLNNINTKEVQSLKSVFLNICSQLDADPSIECKHA